MSEPQWLTLARADIGIAEIAGPQANPRIMAYYKAAHADWATNDDVPWCGAACAAWISGAGYSVPAEAARARAWLDWGDPIDPPKPGAIAVFRRGTDPAAGHVGIFISEENDRIMVLGGNQGDAVSITAHPKAMLLGYRWPSSAPAYEEPMPALVMKDKPLLQSVTIRNALLAGWATLLGFLSDAFDFLMQWVSALTELGPVKTALTATGANAKAISLGLVTWALIKIVTARLQGTPTGAAASK